MNEKTRKVFGREFWNRQDMKDKDQNISKKDKKLGDEKMIAQVQAELNKILAQTKWISMEDIDWFKISRQYHLSKDFIKEYRDKLDMDYLIDQRMTK